MAFYYGYMCIVTSFCLCGVFAQVDKTLVPGATGPNVVRAVIEKIRISNVFASQLKGQEGRVQLFLRDMAYVETRDGSWPSKGGIWNVSQEIFDQTKEYFSEMNKINNSKYLQLNWSDVVYENLSIPMYSGLAITMEINTIASRDQSSLENPSMFWAQNFESSNDMYIWLSAINELRKEESKYSVIIQWCSCAWKLPTMTCKHYILQPLSMGLAIISIRMHTKE